MGAPRHFREPLASYPFALSPSKPVLREHEGPVLRHSKEATPTVFPAEAGIQGRQLGALRRSREPRASYPFALSPSKGPATLSS